MTATRKIITLSVTEDMHEDLRACAEQAMPYSQVLTRLYTAWRKGKIPISTLPDGTKIKGPLV